MKLSNFVIPLAIAALTILGCSSTKSNVDKVRASIIRVTATVEGGQQVCTGFVVKPKVVLTAAHCMGTLLQADGLEATVIQEDGYFDLAALSVPLLKKEALELRDDPVVEGERLVGIGYAWGWNIAIAPDQQVLIPSMKVNPKSPAGIIVQGGYVHGMSGGPLVDLDGKVVGIIQQIAPGTGSAGYGVGVAIMKAFLTDAGVI